MEMQSQKIGKLAEALAKAQGIMLDATLDKKSGQFKSGYASLHSVWKACREALSTNGLSLVQTVEKQEDKIVLTTMLLHSSGQFIKSFLPLYPKDFTMQGIGSAITYARRYSIMSLVGICPDEDEDDDGEKSEGRHKSTNPKKNEPAPLAFEEDYVKQFYVMFSKYEKIAGDLKSFFEGCLKKYQVQPNEYAKGALGNEKEFSDTFKKWQDKKAAKVTEDEILSPAIQEFFDDFKTTKGDKPIR